MKYADIVHRCFRCGNCKVTSDYENFNCPSYRNTVSTTFAPGGGCGDPRLAHGEIEKQRTFQEILYSCATCEAVSNTLYFRRIWSTSYRRPGRNGHSGRIPRLSRDYFKAISIHATLTICRQRTGRLGGKSARRNYKRQNTYSMSVVSGPMMNGEKMAQAVEPVALESRRFLRNPGRTGTLRRQRGAGPGEAVCSILAENNIAFPGKRIKKIITRISRLQCLYKDYPEIRRNFEVRIIPVLVNLIESRKLKPKALPPKQPFMMPVT